MTLFLDACAIIYWREAAEPFYSQLIEAMREIYSADPNTDVAVSRLSQLECFVAPLGFGASELVARYREFFSRPDLSVVELDAPIMERAALLRSTVKKLRTPDAIQAASALSFPADTVFLTSDPVFERVPGLKVRLL
jgi:hypothetical protein